MPITADTSPVFPQTPSYGYIATPTYRGHIPEVESGFERPNRLWSRPLLFITAAPIEDAHTDDIEDVLKFFHAMGGPFTYFRFKDWSDYKSCKTFGTVSALDQPVRVTGVAGTYQLCKEYVVGSIAQRREIYKPIGSTISIANNSGVIQSSANWTLNESNGTFTIGGGFSGTPLTWGGEFDVECRFLEEGLPIEIQDFATRNVRIAFREKRRTSTT